VVEENLARHQKRSGCRAIEATDVTVDLWLEAHHRVHRREEAVDRRGESLLD
jgi:hypothetical protein